MPACARLCTVSFALVQRDYPRMDARDLIDQCDYRRAERAFCAGRSGVAIGRQVSGPRRMYSPQGAQFAMLDVAVTCVCGTTTVNPTGACPYCHRVGAYGVVQ